MTTSVPQSGANFTQPAAADIAKPKASAQFMKGNDSAFYFNWRPALRDSRTDVHVAYSDAAARTIDAVHNSGWLAGCIEQSKANIIGGTGLRLAHMPDISALTDWDAKELNDWSRLVERRFEMWCDDKNECDATGKHTMSMLQEQAVESYYTHGEVLGLLPNIDRPNAITRLKVKMLPPHKLVQDTSESFGLYQGITHGQWGFPIKYRINMTTSYGFEQPLEIMAYDQSRQQVLHIFKGAVGQVRGITPFVHVLKTLKQFDQLSDATLTKALMDALFAATMESQSPTTDLLQALQDEEEQGISGASVTDLLATKAAWYENTKIDLGRSGRIAHLFPGEKLKFNTTSRISNDYEAFVKILLRELARCMGLSFESVTGDYSGATYSSVRMSGSELWPLTLSRRKHIAGRFMTEIFQSWLDEEVMSGRLPFKGGTFAYMAQRKAAARCDWRGPPKPQADDLKAAKAMEVLKRLGIASDEQLCAELGTDYEDVYEQRARERDLREQHDLPDGDTLTPDPVGDALVTETPAAPPAKKPVKKEKA